MGINNRKEQDWWLLCNSTPLVWNQITYTSPTHCQDRVSGFSFKGFTSDADHMLSMTERGKEGRDVGRPRRELPVVDPNLSAFPVIVHLFSLVSTEPLGLDPRPCIASGAPTKYMIDDRQKCTKQEIDDPLVHTFRNQEDYSLGRSRGLTLDGAGG